MRMHVIFFFLVALHVAYIILLYLSLQKKTRDKGKCKDAGPTKVWFEHNHTA